MDTRALPSEPREALELARQALTNAASNLPTTTLGDADWTRYGKTLTAVLNRLAELVLALDSRRTGTDIDAGNHGTENLRAVIAALNEAATHAASYTAATDSHETVGPSLVNPTQRQH